MTARETIARRILESVRARRVKVLSVVCFCCAALPIAFWATGVTEYRESLQPPAPDESFFDRVAAASVCIAVAATFVILLAGLWRCLTSGFAGGRVKSNRATMVGVTIFGIAQIVIGGARFFLRPYCASPIGFCWELAMCATGWFFVLCAYMFRNEARTALIAGELL
jgi:hypothetical protein